MALQLGKVLARCALGPLNYAGSLVMASRVPEALNELTRENLQGGLDRGIDETAKLVGVRRSHVEALLPSDEIRATAEGLATSQAAAVAAWGRHAGGIGGLLQGVADLTTDGRAPDVPLCLERLAKKVSRDKEFAAPLRALAGDVGRWQELIERCQELLDNGDVLARAYRRRRIMTISIVVGFGAAMATVAFIALRIHNAHARVESKLTVAAAAPCAIVELSAEELAGGTSEQHTRADALRAACTAQEEQQARERAERERLEAEARAVREAKEAHETACSTLADHVSSNGLTSADASTAGDSIALLTRVAHGELTTADLAADKVTVPCSDLPAGARLLAAWNAAALKAAWPKLEVIGDPARAVFVEHAKDFPFAQKAAYAKRIDAMAHRAIITGKHDAIAAAAKLCAFAASLGVQPRAYCPGALKLGGNK